MLWIKLSLLVHFPSLGRVKARLWDSASLAHPLASFSTSTYVTAVIIYLETNRAIVIMPFSAVYVSYHKKSRTRGSSCFVQNLTRECFCEHWENTSFPLTSATFFSIALNSHLIWVIFYLFSLSFPTRI